MTVGAFCGGRLIEQHRLIANRLELRMAALARRVLVRPSEREDGLLVIERRWPPPRAVVAVRTLRHAIRVGELRPMWVVVTLLAQQRSFAKIHVQ